MLKRMIFGAGIAYMARKFMGGSRSTNSNSRGGGILGGLFGGGNRSARRSSGW